MQIARMETGIMMQQYGGWVRGMYQCLEVPPRRVGSLVCAMRADPNRTCIIAGSWEALGKCILTPFVGGLTP
jgi:hypothetical protein